MRARFGYMTLASVSLALLSGCAIGKPHMGDTTGLATEPRAQILGDAARELGKLHPPALTKVGVIGDRRDPLREDFSALLRRRGFAVVDLTAKGAAPPKGTLMVQIALTSLGEDTVFTRIRMGDQSATRAYGVLPYVKPMAAWTVDLTGAKEDVEERAARPANFGDPVTAQAQERTPEPVQNASPVVWTNQPTESHDPAPEARGHWLIYMGTAHTRQQAQAYWQHLAHARPGLRQWQHTTFRQGLGRYELLMLGEGDPHKAMNMCHASRAHACKISQ